LDMTLLRFGHAYTADRTLPSAPARPSGPGHGGRCRGDWTCDGLPPAASAWLEVDCIVRWSYSSRALSTKSLTSCVAWRGFHASATWAGGTASTGMYTTSGRA